MSIFMHKYIEWIIDVKGDDNCGYRVVSTLLDNREENLTFVCQQFLKELKAHKETYTDIREI